MIKTGTAVMIQLVLGSSPRLTLRTPRMKLQKLLQLEMLNILKLTRNLKMRNLRPKSRERMMLIPSPKFLSGKPRQAQVLSTPGSPQGRRSLPPPVPHPIRSLSSTQLHASRQLPELEGKASFLPTPLLAETLPLLPKPPPVIRQGLLKPTIGILMPEDPPNTPQLNPGEDTVPAPWLSRKSENTRKVLSCSFLAFHSPA